jgi:PHD/YefM family antitoxin component YafN of YafNO toxin-antitoxin module
MSAVTPERTFQSSELSRNSGGVFRAAEQGPVTVTRRDGEPLVLMRSEEFRRDHEGLEIASIIVAAALSPGSAPLHERLAQSFGWINFLPEHERTACAAELVAIARACAAVAHYDRLLGTVAGWRSTAEAFAGGYTPDRELTWLDEPEPLEDPRTA